MALIRIFANGIELDFVNDTLTLKEENNAFITDFKATYSTYPFLIIENQKAKAALGPKNLASVRKKKVVPVVVLQAGQRYYGELIVTAYLNQYRKCDIKYGSSILAIMSTKCADLLPIIEITGSSTVYPYAEEYYQTVPGYEAWQTYPLDFNRKIYPEVKYGFPQMRWDNQFFEETPEEGDEWEDYAFFVNRYSKPDQNFRKNYFIVTGDSIAVHNENVPAPQLFLLGLLEYIFTSQGWKIAGDFVTNDFVRRLMVLSQKNNLCKVNVGPAPQSFGFGDFTYIDDFVGKHYFRYSFTPEAAGDYEISYAAIEPNRPGGVHQSSPLSFLKHSASSNPITGSGTNIYSNFNDPDEIGFQGTFTLTIDDDMAGHPYYFHYGIDTGNEATPPTISVVFNKQSEVFNMMHPTINLGRYAPDWDVATLLNHIKNAFCLSISFEELSKTASFNFAQDTVTAGEKFRVKDPLAFSEEAPPDYAGFVLKYANDTDAFIYIDTAGTQLNYNPDSDYVLPITSDFKAVDHNGTTAVLDAMEDKDGTGLMVYDPDDEDGFTVPYIAREYNGRTTAITGYGGLYNQYWRKMLAMRLNGSKITVEGAFTGQELAQINALHRVYMGKQAYIVLNTESNQTRQDNFTVKMELMAVTL